MAPVEGAATGRLDALVLNPGELDGQVYVPARRGTPTAVVVALHGCNQTASEYAIEAGWTTVADELGFVLLLPQQRRGNNWLRCFNWTQKDDHRRGRGEAESIRQMLELVSSRYRTDRGQTYVAGISAGGAMAAALLANYPDTFSGGGIVAGIPYGCVTSDSATMAAMEGIRCMQRAQPDFTAARWGEHVRSATADVPAPIRWPTVSIWQGMADHLVNPLNAQALSAQWTHVHGLTVPSPARDQRVSEQLRRRVYHDANGRAVVELWTVAAMAHAWPVDPPTGCGVDRVEATDFTPGNDYTYAAGVCAARAMTRFWGLTE